MILWARRASTLMSSALFFALFFFQAQPRVALLAAVLNLGWAISERMPFFLGKFPSSAMLVTNTGLAAYGIFVGGSAEWAVLVATASLASWNSSRFLEQWPNAPQLVQYRYLKRLGGLVALGMGLGLSALAFQGCLSLPFPITLSVLGITGVLWLRLISEAITRGH